MGVSADTNFVIGKVFRCTLNQNENVAERDEPWQNAKRAGVFGNVGRGTGLGMS